MSDTGNLKDGTANKDPSSPLAVLRDRFGYVFNEFGRLVQWDAEKAAAKSEGFVFDVHDGDRAKNQKRYEDLGKHMDEVVYQILELEGLERVELENKSFVFASRGYTEKKFLMVLIHGSGVVRAGQWSRRLIINEDLNKGTMVPYVRAALARDYGVVAFNTNDENEEVGRGSVNAFLQARNAWGQLVKSAKGVENVVVVAHSFGGEVVAHLAQEYPEDFLARVFFIALTDPVHAPDARATARLAAHLAEVKVSFLSSDKKLGTELRDGEVGCKRVSAGHPIHEYSSEVARPEVLRMMDEKAAMRAKNAKVGPVAVDTGYNLCSKL